MEQTASLKLAAANECALAARIDVALFQLSYVCPVLHFRRPLGEEQSSAACEDTSCSPRRATTEVVATSNL
jgi:hypothetical protein